MSLQAKQQAALCCTTTFPPYCVGETGMIGSPKRREIGHGRLAKRGVQAVMPTQSEFPYTVRVVSEITESNGSSSMASVCGSSLALMDAGVPIKASVAGIAMGLVKEDENFVVLSDILVMKITWAIWTLKLQVRKKVLLPCKWTSKSKVLTQTSCVKLLDQARSTFTYLKRYGPSDCRSTQRVV